MAWILGIDEAGYGPNLGPFVMSSVACQLPDPSCDLWQVLRAVARRAAEDRDDRLVVDDSKEVYTSALGLAGLEKGVGAVLSALPATLGELTEQLCPLDGDDLAGEPWFHGTTRLPTQIDEQELRAVRERFAGTCLSCEVDGWRVESVVVCPRRFNELIARHDSKSAVLGYGFIRLFGQALAQTEGPLAVFVDKQGGRNSYAAQIQEALTEGLVVPEEERTQRSRYCIVGLPRSVRLTFQPRADQSYFCVALASMVSKYLRELFMVEFNGFWQEQVPGLKPTAGYPGDARRFFEAIQDRAATLKIPEGNIWRCR